MRAVHLSRMAPLQLGRAPEGAEGSGAPTSSPVSVRLQLGRAPEGAEGGYTRTVACLAVTLQLGRAPEGAEGVAVAMPCTAAA